jgi:histidine triad (HIT) family protein
MPPPKAESTDCLFCAIAAKTKPSHVVVDAPGVFVFLDRTPVFKGHCLVVPRAHVETLVDLSADAVEPLMRAVRGVARAVEEGLGCDGTFVAMNNRVSQSVPHLHVHVVPRKRKDGLKGFFWPRVKYASDEEMAEFASRIATRFDPAF